jgi:hypothetical protein
MSRSLIALILAAALPAAADDHAPVPAGVSYGPPAEFTAAPAFEPRRRVQQVAGHEAVPAVVVVRGIAAGEITPAMSMSPDAEVVRALAALCRVDPNGGTIAANLPALPARF